ncbi:hypothetical protein QAD02_022511 [Eretmocerus hayati]|uniref:Uncharacterized protein n=1 Tax=Eretmocerus hayati TaxID=131215 RepID=A0ACC2PTH1_9HYME|nr:hypothetical protein QAD02_022511 [Eretmocerus hayati]
MVFRSNERIYTRKWPHQTETNLWAQSLRYCYTAATDSGVEHPWVYIEEATEESKEKGGRNSVSAQRALRQKEKEKKSGGSLRGLLDLNGSIWYEASSRARDSVRVDFPTLFIDLSRPEVTVA